MSIMDAKLQLCDAQSLASATTSGTHVGNIIDLEAAGKDGWGNSLVESLGEGGQIYLNVAVTTVFSAHSAELALMTDSALASSAMASATKIVSIWIPASSPAGTKKSIAVPSGGLLRYVQMLADVSSNSLTGAIEAWLSCVPQDSQIATKLLK